MKFRILVLINATAVAITLSAVNYYFQHSWYYVIITFLVTIATSFIIFYYLIEKYVYSKIKLIYKLIHNLKLGRDLRDALGEHISADPINDVEAEVKEWAREKKTEALRALRLKQEATEEPKPAKLVKEKKKTVRRGRA